MRGQVWMDLEGSGFTFATRWETEELPRGHVTPNDPLLRSHTSRREWHVSVQRQIHPFLVEIRIEPATPAPASCPPEWKCLVRREQIESSGGELLLSGILEEYPTGVVLKPGWWNFELHYCGPGLVQDEYEPADDRAILTFWRTR